MSELARSGPGIVSLGLWPTPLQAGEAAAGIYVKREDLCGFAFGGSKVRALETVAGEVCGRGARSIVTGGRRDSNWVALATAAAHRLGLDCHCVLDPGPEATLAMALARRVGEGGAAPAAVRTPARRLRILLARQRAWRRDAQSRAGAAIGHLIGQARTASAQPAPCITPTPEVLS